MSDTLTADDPAAPGQPDGGQRDPAAENLAPAAAQTASGKALRLPGPQWLGSTPAGQPVAQTANPWDVLLREAADSDAGKQFLTAFTGQRKRILERATDRAVKRLASNEPVDPNDKDTWYGKQSHVEAVINRHGLSKLASRLTDQAWDELIARQADIDADAGIDWTVLHPAGRLDEQIRRANTTLPIDLDDPAVWMNTSDQRRAACKRLELADHLADDLSRWALANPGEFDAQDIRSWRIGSQSWLDLANDVLPPVDNVDRPVAAFVVPEQPKYDSKGAPRNGTGRGWQLVPSLSLDMIRLVYDLGGIVDRSLARAEIPHENAVAFLGRINQNTLHAGPKENLDVAGKLSEALTGEFGVPVNPGKPNTAIDRWGRLHVHRSRYEQTVIGADKRTASGAIVLNVVTYPTKGMTQKRLGSRSRTGQYEAGSAPSAVMELGEAVESAVERNLPLLLSTEAAGALHGVVRVGRLKGRPGMVNVTTSDGMSATTRRYVAEQAVAELRRLKRDGARVIIDAGAKQVIRMTVARPLTDDAILKGRQQEVAAIMAVGSGVNASQTGAGKTIMSGRTIYHGAATTSRFRAMIVAEGRLLSQWRDELAHGAPARGLPALAPNVRVVIVDDRSSVAAQIRAADRDAGGEAVVYLVPDSILDRYTADLQVIGYHLLIADEAQRYVNPATEAHIALKRLRFTSVINCWLLTATPQGKSAEDLDVLEGLALGDDAMIRERLNTREAGDLMDETNAHRLRVNFGPHLVRVTREDMAQWMPTVRPAVPQAVEPDGALLELLDAIRTGGRQAYRALLKAVQELKTLESGSALYKQALAEMSRAQAMVLSNVNVFVDASVDPETLTHSDAALAQALCEQGLPQEAMRGGGDGLPLLRGITAQTVSNVVRDEQVIVFAERNWCLRQLAGTLRDRYGVDARVADGRLSSEEFEHMKHEFQAGAFPVLCLSKVGQQGHNFQNASTLVHLDLPWTPKPLEQRVGRSARPGSSKGYVQTFIPYIKGGGVEHIVSILTPRGAEHHQILDSFEGVKASESTVANQLGQIASDVAASKHDAGYELTAARLRVAASVFGS